MNIERYSKVGVKLSNLKIQLFGILAVIVLLVFGIAVHAIIWREHDVNITGLGILLLFLLLFAGFIVHELLHAVGFVLFADASFSDFKFGIMWRYGSFYTHCRKTVPLRGVRPALLLPMLVTGVLPLIIGIGTNMLLLTVLGSFLTAGGIGDVIMFLKLRRFPADALVYDDPDAPGCEVYMPPGTSSL